MRINFDETAICLFQGGGKGNLMIAKGCPLPTQNVSRNQRRTYITYVSFICDDPDIQRALPQVLIANERSFPLRDMAALRAACPPHVHLWRERSAWVNERLCVQLVRLLGETLRPYMGGAQPFLVFDASRAHVTRDVFRACAAARLWSLLIPAKLTWLLQPLDTHAFLPYKVHLQKEYQEARVGIADGVVRMADLLRCVHAAMERVIRGRAWAVSFERDGFGLGQLGVSQRVLAHLGLEAPPTISSLRPSLEQLQRCFPKRAQVPEAQIWEAVGHARVAAAQVAESGGGPHPELRRSARIAAARARASARAADRLAVPAPGFHAGREGECASSSSTGPVVRVVAARATSGSLPPTRRWRRLSSVSLGRSFAASD